MRQLVLDLAQVHGELAHHTQELTARFNETPARWKVLTAAACDVRTVPQIARRMGLTRQAVQRIANQLVGEGLLELASNPDHKASPILQATQAGKELDDAIAAEHRRWRTTIASELDRKRVESTLATLRELSERLAN